MHFAARKVYKPAKPRANERRATKTASTEPLTNVVSIDLGELAEKVVLLTGDPATCSSCAAIFNVTSKTPPGENGKPVWQCEFCDNKNIIRLEDEEIPKSDTCDYMIEPPAQVSVSQSTGTVIFCVDISGSMCVTTELSGKHKLMGDKSQTHANLNTEGGLQWLPRESRNVTYVSRLQCVQADINSQLENLHKQYPGYHVGLVCFNNEVTIYGDGTKDPVIITGDKLSDYNALLELGTQYTLQNSIGQSKDALAKKLYELSEMGSTALGPAVTVAVGMTQAFPGSKIVIATDGLANTGVGAMDNEMKVESPAYQETLKFYEQLALYAKLKAITVSVIGIRGENLNLALLGKLADITQGNVDLVDPIKITENFSSILQSKLVATEVTVKLFLHKGFEFPQDDEWICPPATSTETTNTNTTTNTTTTNTATTPVVNTFQNNLTPEKKKRQLYALRHIGNAYDETEITAEFLPSTDDVVLSQIFGEKKEEKKEEEEKGEKTTGKTEGHAAAKTQLPFQVQITYRSLSGMKCTRVITKTKEVTDDRHEVEQDVDINVMGMHANWMAAKFAQKGDLDAAITNNNNYAQLMQQNVTSEESNYMNAWVSDTANYNKHLEGIQQRRHQPQYGKLSPQVKPGQPSMPPPPPPQVQPQSLNHPQGFFGAVSSFANNFGSTLSNAIGSIAPGSSSDAATAPAPAFSFTTASSDALPSPTSAPTDNYAAEVDDDETQNLIFARRNAKKNRAQWSSKRKY